MNVNRIFGYKKVPGEFSQKMDGDLSEGGMQTVALGDGAASGETNYQPAAGGGPALAPAPNSGMPLVQSSTAPSTQPIPTPQARPTSLPQYPHTPGSAYASPNSANSPEYGNKWDCYISPFPAMSPVPLATPTTPNSENGAALVRSGSSKMETIKTWSISTYKCTKQLLSEKLGKSSRTVDAELEAQIEALRDTQRKYSQILRLARALSSHFYHVVQTQQQLGDAFADLAQSPELQEEFIYNAETQRTLTKNGETLLGALNFFVSSVNTLCNKTMEDTLLTVKLYESARIEYDAYRSDLEMLSQQPRSEISSIKLEEAQRNFNGHKAHYDRLRADVAIKLKFLEENKVKVMHKQLLLFHNAVSAYFSGNQTALEATLKQFSIKLRSPNSAPPSWLEQSVPETFQTIFGSLNSPTK
ncbi:arfaptin-2-like isoform X2 [Eriocheir sinensis]|uniref:arfaptin-2-like isoform X2 n=1 Tax=Eriocheir sinensis TaxID=95602 RepID=UPI0021C96A00|nr:arfaptin-2-like isoform X2 [Eriocheir sinensis]